MQIVPTNEGAELPSIEQPNDGDALSTLPQRASFDIEISGHLLKITEEAPVFAHRQKLGKEINIPLTQGLLGQFEDSLGIMQQGLREAAALWSCQEVIPSRNATAPERPLPPFTKAW